MMRSLQNQRGLRGLSLLEVIVALVIISAFGAALFVWAGQTLQTASRAARLQQEAELERNVTEIAYSLNPALRPSGELLTPTHRYQWQAQVERSLSDQPRAMYGISPWQVGLYRVRFTITDLSAPAEPQVSERRVAGYRQVRTRQTGPPGFTLPTLAPPP